MLLENLSFTAEINCRIKTMALKTPIVLGFAVCSAISNSVPIIQAWSRKHNRTKCPVQWGCIQVEMQAVRLETRLCSAIVTNDQVDVPLKSVEPLGDPRNTLGWHRLSNKFFTFIHVIGVVWRLHKWHKIGWRQNYPFTSLIGRQW